MIPVSTRIPHNSEPLTIKVRLRHPRGVTTIEVDPSTQGVDDLKVLIFSSTEIPPSEQESGLLRPPAQLTGSQVWISTETFTRHSRPARVDPHHAWRAVDRHCRTIDLEIAEAPAPSVRQGT